MSDPIPTPALDAWRRRGSLDTYDTLWRAACWEAAAVTAAADGSNPIPLLERAHDAILAR